MNNHVEGFLIKFAGTLVILYLILGYAFRITFLEVLLLTTVLVGLSYWLGDLFILSRTNNVFAAIVDFVVAWGVIYLFIRMMTPVGNVLNPSLLATTLIIMFEVFFHRYMIRNVLRNGKAVNQKVDFQTEFAKEFYTENIREKNKRD